MFVCPWLRKCRCPAHPRGASHRKAGNMYDEASYICGACGEEIVVPIDFSQGSEQQYVEDCPVCCRANVVRVDIDPNGEVSIRAELE